MISRDADSRLSLREKEAVEKWINSDKDFHIMRDHPHHYYPILGGTWGFKNYVKRIGIKAKMLKRNLHAFGYPVQAETTNEITYSQGAPLVNGVNSFDNSRIKKCKCVIVRVAGD